MHLDFYSQVPQLPSNPECSAHFSSTVALVLPWQWLTSVCRVTLHSQTWDIWESRPPVMSTFPWVLCSWGGGGRSSQELVRATGRGQHSHSLSHTQIQAAYRNNPHTLPLSTPQWVCQLSLTSRSSREEGSFPSLLPFSQVILTGCCTLGMPASLLEISILSKQPARGEREKKVQFCLYACYYAVVKMTVSAEGALSHTVDSVTSPGHQTYQPKGIWGPQKKTQNPLTV